LAGLGSKKNTSQELGMCQLLINAIAKKKKKKISSFYFFALYLQKAAT
jgi:hypothetical protein